MNGRRHQAQRRDAAIAAANGKGWPAGQLALSPCPRRSMERPGASWLQLIHAVRAPFSYGVVRNLRSVPAVVTRGAMLVPMKVTAYFQPPSP